MASRSSLANNPQGDIAFLVIRFHAVILLYVGLFFCIHIEYLLDLKTYLLIQLLENSQWL